MAEERPFSEVLQDIVRSLQDLVRAEIQLATAEVREDVADAARRGAWLAGGVVAVAIGLTFLLWSAVFALSQVVPLWAAALGMGVSLGVAGALCVRVGLRRLRTIRLRPERTIASVKETVAWIKPSST